MKNKHHKMSQLKHTLYQQKNKLRGKKDFAVMSLTLEEVEFVEKFCEVTPYIYRVAKNFRPGFNPKTASGIVKHIYYAKRSPVYVVLDKNDVKKCVDVGLKPIPYKYKVWVSTLK